MKVCNGGTAYALAGVARVDEGIEEVLSLASANTDDDAAPVPAGVPDVAELVFPFEETLTTTGFVFLLPMMNARTRSSVAMASSRDEWPTVAPPVWIDR